MKNILSIINSILVYIIILRNSFCYLIIPFKTHPSQIKDTDKNLTLLLRSLKYNNIYINLEVGEPKQEIEAFLRLDGYNFYLSEKNKSDLRTISENPDIYDVGSDLSKFFDKNKSTSLEITDKIKSTYSSNKGNVSYDYIHFFSYQKEIIKKKLPFILYNTTLGNMPGVIGLQFIRSEIEKEFNFIDKLKKNDIINYYNWMINYTSENEGNFIIGELPHIIDPEHFKEEDLLMAHPFTYSAMSLKWGLRFDEITFRGNNFRPYHECYFHYELNFIRGIEKLEKELDKYFNESIKNGTCFKEDIKYPYGPKKFFYCNKDKYKENIKYFPPLEFYHIELNYTFELNYKDLFIEKNNKLILMIFFEEYGMEWDFGKPFLKKYSFVMNQDSRMIGFYDRKLNNENFNNYVILKIILIIIGIIILLALGIFIGKYIFKDKKNRINTIEEEYDYTSKKDEIN